MRKSILMITAHVNQKICHYSLQLNNLDSSPVLYYQVCSAECKYQSCRYHVLFSLVISLQVLLTFS